MLFLSLLAATIPTLVVAQGKPDSGCPKLTRSAPSPIKPKNCPDPKTVPAVKGTLRDNECLVGGIMGVCTFSHLNFLLAALTGEYERLIYRDRATSSMPAMLQIWERQSVVL